MRAVSLAIFLLISELAYAQMPNLMNVDKWAYQLQNININQVVTDTSFELIILDYSQDGTDATKFLPQQITQIRNSGKKVIAYISIGEAEDYRFYWQGSWDTNPPSWMGPSNPDWPGNYKVRFWDPDWQNIVFAYIDTIINQGFDGIYLDIIDAYYYWQFENPEESLADSMMVQFVLNIRNHISGITSDTFYIIPQNGEFVTEEGNVSDNLKTAYFDAINGIGVEDVFYEGNLDEDNSYNPDNDRILQLQEYLLNNNQVFSIEYLTQASKILQYINEATTQQFVPYTCVRELDQLCSMVITGICEGRATYKTKFMVYPNPASIYVNIKFDIPMPEDLIVKVYNALGVLIREIRNIDMINSISNTFYLDLSDWKHGLYLLEIEPQDREIGFHYIFVTSQE